MNDDPQGPPPLSDEAQIAIIKLWEGDLRSVAEYLRASDDYVLQNIASAIDEGMVVFLARQRRKKKISDEMMLQLGHWIVHAEKSGEIKPLFAAIVQFERKYGFSVSEDHAKRAKKMWLEVVARVERQQTERRDPIT